MPRRRLLIVSDAPDTFAPQVERVLSFWPPPQRPTLAHVTPAEVTDEKRGPAALEPGGVAWIILTGDDEGLIYELVAALQDQHVPTAVSVFNDPHAAGDLVHDAMVAAPLDTEPATLCAMLRSLWSTSGIVRGLSAELKLVKLHSGGLVDQIDRIDEELRLAAQLQREFLPHKLPSVEALEFKVLFRPAGYVSGDIYDVFSLDESHVGFYLADAVGHGVPAALMTMFIKRSLPTKEIDATLPRGYRIVPPAEALRRLNQDMALHQGGKCRFATACYGVLNHQTLELSFARAGHPFPYILHADGRVDQLEPDGGLLGIFPEETFEQVNVTLTEGDRLLLYSDGFELAFREKLADADADTDQPPAPRKRAASDQYTREFKDLARGTVDEAMDRMVTRLDSSAGSLNQQDDLTAVLVAVKQAA